MIAERSKCPDCTRSRSAVYAGLVSLNNGKRFQARCGSLVVVLVVVVLVAVEVLQ